LLRTDTELNEGVQKIRDLCALHQVGISTSDKLVHRLAPKESHLSVGVFRKYETPLDAKENHVVLVNPNDMGNLGTIMRSMIGFGVSHLALIRPAADYFDPKVVRASMGALFQMSVECFDSFEAYRARFDHQLYAFVTGAGEALNQMRFESPYALVFGNEGEGLPESIAAQGTAVRIPQSPRVDSLNLAVAVGIVLYSASL
jgi:TrmH family RNA methyltransferase